MGRVSKLTAAEIATVVALGKELGQNAASKELAKIGIDLSPGGVHHYMTRVGLKKKRVTKPKPKVVAQAQ